MKAIKVIDIEVSSDRPPENLPPQAERELASMTNSEGSQLITLWLRGRKNMFNTELTKTRNCATLDTYDLASVIGPELSFPAINGVEVADIGGYVAKVTRPAATDWTLIFAGQPRDTGAAGTNYGLFGNNTLDNKGYVNAPNLNITQAGSLRVASTSANSSYIINYAGHGSAIFTAPHVIIVTQSEANGMTLRVDGAQVATRTDATGKAKSTGTEHDVFRSGNASAVFKGKMGELMLLSDDLTKDPARLAKFETYLKGMYGIA